MQKLTEQQYNNVLKAIELAKGPGSCKYFADDDTPMCVIAQLAKIEGDDYLSLKGLGCTVRIAINGKKFTGLSKYDIDFLYDLQRNWDSTNEYHEAEVKRGMKSFAEDNKNV